MIKLEVKDLSFSYGSTLAVKRNSFKLNGGSIVGLVGPNGAGKTTLMRCISGLEEPDWGEIFLNGKAELEPRVIFSKIAFLADDFGLYDDLTVRENIEYAAQIRNVQNAKEETERVAKELNLTDLLNRKAKALSKGQRQRMGIAAILVAKPSIIILDEPAAGLDPEARQELSRTIKAMKNQDRIIIVSSHILTELNSYCDTVMILKDGTLVGIEALSSQELNLAIKTSKESEACEYLQKLGYEPQIIDGQIMICFAFEKSDASDILKDLINKDLPISNFARINLNFEQVYFNKTKL